MRRIVPVTLAAALMLGGTLLVNQVFAQENDQKKARQVAEAASRQDAVRTQEEVKLTYADDDDRIERAANTKASDRETLISREEAIAIAKQLFNGEAKEVELDREDGRYEVEIELSNGDTEAEFEIDARTGEVLRFEYDDDEDDDDDDDRNERAAKAKAPASESLISREEAIAIAKQYFDGKVDEVELERDDGKYVYEIELRSGDSEAEFEIDARTGKVLEIEIDDDDD